MLGLSKITASVLSSERIAAKELKGTSTEFLGISTITTFLFMLRPFDILRSYTSEQFTTVLQASSYPILPG